MAFQLADASKEGNLSKRCSKIMHIEVLEGAGEDQSRIRRGSGDKKAP
jgi:hypothetical protein